MRNQRSDKGGGEASQRPSWLTFTALDAEFLDAHPQFTRAMGRPPASVPAPMAVGRSTSPRRGLSLLDRANIEYGNRYTGIPLYTPTRLL